MNKVRARMPGFCMSRAVARVRVPVPSPSHRYRKTNSLIRRDEKNEFSSKGSEMSFSCYVSKPDDSESGNRVMVFVDSGAESKAALEWALSHTVQIMDTIILVHVTKPPRPGGDRSLENERAFEVLRSMKNLCLDKRPGVNVEMSLQEGKEKGAVIVEAAKRLKVSLLVLGQRKRSVLWRLRMVWPGNNRTQSRAVDYCIQNANCMTIAVRRKGKKYGGYLITTKRHKKFWLLA